MRLEAWRSDQGTEAPPPRRRPTAAACFPLLLPVPVPVLVLVLVLLLTELQPKLLESTPLVRIAQRLNCWKHLSSQNLFPLRRFPRAFGECSSGHLLKICFSNALCSRAVSSLQSCWKAPRL
jgi:hypothetical protein